MRNLNVIAMLFVMVGCASQSLTLKQTELTPYKDANQLTRLNGVAAPIQIISVEDKRSTNVYGSAYTGVQYQKTPLVFDASLDSLIRDYMKTAFSHRDIVLSQDSGTPLQVNVEELWVEEVIEQFQPEKAKCSVKLSFHINKPAKKWSGSYWAEYTSPGDMGDGTEKLTPTLASCLNEVVEKLIKDEKFVEMLKE